jgi:hypothetical protein
VVVLLYECDMRSTNEQTLPHRRVAHPLLHRFLTQTEKRSLAPRIISLWFHRIATSSEGLALRVDYNHLLGRLLLLLLEVKRNACVLNGRAWIVC